MPFEILKINVLPDGFNVTFTQPVDAQLAASPSTYLVSTYTYIFQSTYGSPEVDHTSPEVKSALVSEDGRSVRLKVQGLQIGACS